jgi:predicted secreted protein
MAQPKILRGTYFSLMLGNGGTPTETFEALCGITTRNFTHANNTNDVFTRDCADPENVPVRNLIVTGEQWDLTGTGVLNRDNLDTIIAADDGLTHNWRYLFTEPTGDEVFQGYYAGPAIMTRFEITSEDANFANISITLASDGSWSWNEVTPT